MINLFHDLSERCSKITTEKYSTSFSIAIKLLHKEMHAPIYNIYGFVRFSDEIVDTFHQYNKEELLADFKKETYTAIEKGISLNPILNSFQLTVNQYAIPLSLIETFFKSMEMDLRKTTYNSREYNEYIYGSAEVVGLMCLIVFCEKDMQKYEALKPYAKSLGAAFQKINFLRDVQADYKQLNRTYFPGVDFIDFTCEQKKLIEKDIEKDFEYAYHGILQLPSKAKFGVYVAYRYYVSLFRKIKREQAAYIIQNRVRIPDYSKMFILAEAGLRSRLNLL